MFTKFIVCQLVVLASSIAWLDCKLIDSPFDVDQKQPVIKEIKRDEFWLESFFNILFNYSTLLVPILVIVYSVKNNYCFLPVQQSKFIQIFVYGKLSISNDSELESQLLDDKNSDKLDKKDVESSKLNFNYLLTFLSCFAGLQLSYLIWGVIQEKIMTTHYTLNSNLSSHNDELFRFKDSQFLVLINRVLSFAFASIALVGSNLKDRWSKKSYYVPKTRQKYLIAPLNEFVYCSLSNVLSSWCQYEALKYVNFPTQVLSKACKLLAVMFMSQLLFKKRYKRIEYLFALSITIGMSLFLFGNQQLQDKYIKKLNEKTEDQLNLINRHTFLDGILILILYVTFDAFTSNWQGKLFEKYAISSLQMMAIVNFYSIGFTLVSLTETGSLLNSLKLVLNCTDLFRDCFLLSICSATGQLFVFFTISKFGPLLFTTIMTLRQALAILLSCLIYKHDLSALSILGICLVFGALFYQIYWKTSSRVMRSTKMEMIKK